MPVGKIARTSDGKVSRKTDGKVVRETAFCDGCRCGCCEGAKPTSITLSFSGVTSCTCGSGYSIAGTGTLSGTYDLYPTSTTETSCEYSTTDSSLGVTWYFDPTCSFVTYSRSTSTVLITINRTSIQIQVDDGSFYVPYFFYSGSYSTYCTGVDGTYSNFITNCAYGDVAAGGGTVTVTTNY